ncbi:hypothetical protein [Nitrosomonas oligotropha]|uniref:hypothetical protein n=1 Tax=Nitrosomonas oligotropha TaxID=42354 RepID=UPI001371CD9A|nr:hypothetical protein [Nitrosomonas oligotropha]MXS84171.1 hypothetical protein [Nitrosomonas oligotropha]
MHTNKNARWQAGENTFTSTKSSANYTTLDNFMISLIIWQFLPLSQVNLFVNRHGVIKHDR